MFNIFLPMRTGLRTPLMAELAQIKQCVLLVPHESFDITPANETEAMYIRSASLDKILETSKIHTFQNGKAKSQYIWNAIAHTFSTSKFEATDPEEALGKIMEEAEKVLNLKNQLVERGTPLVTLMQDFSGYNALFFTNPPAFNFVIPYLSVSDFSDELAEEFKNSMISMSNGNAIIEVELSNEMAESLHLRKVDGIKSADKVSFHRISETIDEYSEIAVNASKEAPQKQS